MADDAQDARFWTGRVLPGREAEHSEFLAWLASDEAHELFRRRRLTEYLLAEQDGTVTVVFRAPHTGDPRIMIDFLRYPGLWPDFWQFAAGGVWDDRSLPGVKVHWSRSRSRSRRQPGEQGG